jgi:hypothetical protein
MLRLIFLREGYRMFLRSMKAKKYGFKQYRGNDREICSSIIDDCWNGRYFQVSTGNFPEFWTRDFGWCCKSLIKLGYGNKVRITLEYVLDAFNGAGTTATAISPYGKAYDFPTYSPDTLAFLMRSLREAKAHNLVDQYGSFLEAEATRFFKKSIDSDTGLIRSDRLFSSMKDYAFRKSCCYDNVMAAMLKEDLSYFGLENPLKDYNLKKQLIDRFWNGRYFIDSIGSDYISGDANIMPFWTGIISSTSMLKKSIGAITKEGLEKPFPLKYTEHKQKMLWLSILSPDYQGDSIWTHIGPMFIDVLRRINRNKAERYLNSYKRMIEGFRTYPEVLTKEGKPYSSLFYYSDEGMLWSSMYLALKK